MWRRQDTRGRCPARSSWCHNCHHYPIMFWAPEASMAHKGAIPLDEDPLVSLGFDNGLINKRRKAQYRSAK